MIFYPALDLMEGKVVRLKQGNPKERILYNPDPVAKALDYAKQGARWLHLVDLDAAMDTKSVNPMWVREILGKVTVPVQLGGGIRSMNSIRIWLRMGVERIVLGTLAVERPDFLDEALQRFGPSRIAVSLDVQDGKIRTHGWRRETGISAIWMAQAMSLKGVQHLIVTDIRRDGMLSGSNLGLWERIGNLIPGGVVGSGGIRNLEDVRRAVSYCKTLAGLILGRCLYEGKMDLPSLIEEFSGAKPCSQNG